MSIDPLFTSFDQATSALTMPQKFTFPFYYDPHPLSILAAEQLQKHLGSNHRFNQLFGLQDDQSLNTALATQPSGKMFGVLVVKNADCALGYLFAFSGKVDVSNHHQGFVLSDYDMIDDDGFVRP